MVNTRWRNTAARRAVQLRPGEVAYRVPGWTLPRHADPEAALAHSLS